MPPLLLCDASAFTPHPSVVSTPRPHEERALHSISNLAPVASSTIMCGGGAGCRDRCWPPPARLKCRRSAARRLASPRAAGAACRRRIAARANLGPPNVRVSGTNVAPGCNDNAIGVDYKCKPLVCSIPVNEGSRKLESGNPSGNLAAGTHGPSASPRGRWESAANRGDHNAARLGSNR